MRLLLLCVAFAGLIAPAMGAETPPKVDLKTVLKGLPNASDHERNISQTLKAYTAVSEEKLEELTQVLQRDQQTARQDWPAACKQVLGAIDEVKTAVSEALNTKVAPEDAPPVQLRELSDYVTEEESAWKNVQNIGGQIAMQHDALAALSTKLFECKLRFQKATAARKTKLMALNVAIGSLVPLTGVAGETLESLLGVVAEKVVERAEQRLAEINKLELRARAYDQDLVAAATEIQRFRGLFRANDVSAVLKGALSKDIDPDRRGVFNSFEVQWEEAMTERLRDYEEQYAQFSVAIEPWLGNKVFNEYRELRDAEFGKLETLVQKRHKKLEEMLEKWKREQMLDTP